MPHKKLVSVVLIGDDCVKFQKVFSHYAAMDDGDSMGLMTRSALLRLLILKEWESIEKQ